MNWQVKRFTSSNVDRKRGRLFIWIDNETVPGNFVERRTRPYGEWREQVLPVVAKQLGLNTLRGRWSQKCGCSCGCSPGFILSDLTYTDVHVTVTAC